MLPPGQQHVLVFAVPYSVEKVRLGAGRDGDIVINFSRPGVTPECDGTVILDSVDVCKFSRGLFNVMLC